MSNEKPEYGPHVTGSNSQLPDMHHRRHSDLPGAVAQRLDVLEMKLLEGGRMADMGSDAESEVTLRLASGRKGHDVAVCLLLTRIRQCAVLLGLEINVTQAIRKR